MHLLVFRHFICRNAHNCSIMILHACGLTPWSCLPINQYNRICQEHDSIRVWLVSATVRFVWWRREQQQRRKHWLWRVFGACSSTGQAQELLSKQLLCSMDGSGGLYCIHFVAMVLWRITGPSLISVCCKPFARGEITQFESMTMHAYVCILNKYIISFIVLHSQVQLHFTASTLYICIWQIMHSLNLSPRCFLMKMLIRELREYGKWWPHWFLHGAFSRLHDQNTLQTQVTFIHSVPSLPWWQRLPYMLHNELQAWSDTCGCRCVTHL